ncbi:MAG: DUF1295 domain-containing protein [Chloroflexi bacterium]|nr:DUF1295 domain-containing protein [Chloroflexota bacterium]
MSFFEIFALGGFVVFVYVTLLWFISLALKNSSIVDIFWGLGFVLATGVYFMLSNDGYQGRQLLMLALVAIWGIRLSVHIGRRNIGKGEDFRYANWRRQYAEKWWWRSYLQVFLLQGLILWLISTPLLTAQYHATPDHFTVLDILGLLVWGIGFFFEAVGDWQLMVFKANPANKGKVLNTGLWRYTRHPNYFGDATLWWGYFLIALTTHNGFLTIYAPAFMTFLLMKVSGVAMLEKTLVETKPQYRDYVQATNAFFPGPPRKS